MRISAFAAFVVFATVSAVAGESLPLARGRVWARDPSALVAGGEGGTYVVRHTGRRDWAVNALLSRKVSPGDAFRFACRVRRNGTTGGCGPSVVLKDAKGAVISWSYGKATVSGEVAETRFMIPEGGASLEARIVGSGPCDVEISALEFEFLGNRFCGGCEGARLESPALRLVLGRRGDLEVTDIRNGRVYRTVPRRTAPTLVSVRKEALTLVAEFVDPESLRTYRGVFAAEKDRPEFLVTVEAEGPMRAAISYPMPFATVPGERLIIPMNEGISYPVDDPDVRDMSLITYGGHGVCMSFFGVQDDATGAGHMAIFETPDDAAVAVERDRETKLLTVNPSWHDQKREFGYPRKVRYVFFDRGGYVAMAKRYRAYAKEIGKFKSFVEKVKERPNVDRLLGAVNIWTWDGNKAAFAEEIRAAGIDRFLWSGGGNAEEVTALSKMPDVLVGRYDVYQDVYRPDQLRKLGWKRGSNTEAWPHDVVWNSADSNDWRHAWGVKAKDGEWTYCAMMCDKAAPAYERRNVAEELKTKPFNTRFIDTTVASPWQTCWNPAHPMTRSDSRHWKMELLRILGDEFKLVVGSETGHDASVPYCDYYEGMLSLGPYRVPDSGRKMSEIWTNVPPRVAKFQLGESYRLPLWELVYHDCVCAHWYWGDYNNKLPSLWDKRDLFNVLYGTMGMFMMNRRQWKEDKDRFVKSFRMTSPVARATGMSEMLDHRILSADRTVQRSRFADGTVVTVNFGATPYRLEDGSELPGMSHRVTSSGK